MKKINLLFLFLLAITFVSHAYPSQKTLKNNSSQADDEIVIENGGTGPYSAIITEYETLPGMTVYRPKDLTPFTGNKKLPILLWGNGACANTTEEHKNFLNEIVSHGYILIGIGLFDQIENRDPNAPRVITKSSQLIEALDWIIEQNNSSSSEFYGKIETSKIASMGMSCGGLQAIEISDDPRITTTIVCNSGVLPEPSPMGAMPSLTKDDLQKYHNPVLYIIGGPTDIAYDNAMDDFSKVSHVPIVMTNYDVGHGGTYRQPHGGAFTKVALAWLNWQLKGIDEDAKEFLGEDCGLCEDSEWDIEIKNF